ncbi:MAG: hypothetical protein M3020_02445 [Myxococcota bacterium]|nr:hypothetical protein [Myxococcota bacterium]
MGGGQYLFLTEQIADAAAVLSHYDGAWEMFGGGREKQVPKGGRPIAPKRLRDADWDAVAEHPTYRETFSVPAGKLECGRELAEYLDGVRFTGGPGGTDILVITSDVGPKIDVFLRSAARAELALTVPFEH